MPKPRAGESESEWMARCVPKLINEGNSQDQAVAICVSMFEESNKMELKHLTAGLELKNLDEGGGFEGYASVFGVQDFDGDVIVKGAFEKSLKRMQEGGKLPKMLWQHNPTEIIGKFDEMAEDDHGLFVKGHLIMEVQRGREAYALLKAGQLDAMSVGFNITSDIEETRGMGRVIDEVDLWEVSLVTWGANPDALVTGVKTARKSIRDFEQFLRDAGFSRNEAKGIASNGFKAINQRDADANTMDNVLQELKKLNERIKA